MSAEMDFLPRRLA